MYHTHTHKYVYIHTNMRAHTHTYNYVNTHGYKIYIVTYIQICTHTRVMKNRDFKLELNNKIHFTEYQKIA